MRFTRWTIALAAAALLALPGGVSAQQTPPATPPPSTSPSTSQPAAPGEQRDTALEHLTQAKAALNDIPTASLDAAASARVNELNRRITALEKSARASRGPSEPATGEPAIAQDKPNWSTEAGAIDRIVTELLGGQSATAPTEPTGPVGTTGTPPTASSTAREGASITLDETTRTKLQQVRTHITAFAAAMSASGRSAGTVGPDASRAASAAESTSPATAAAPTATAPTEPTQAPTEPAQTAPPTTSPRDPQSPTSTPPPAQPEQSQPEADAETVKRHLTAARDSLSQLTQLPAATQLTGEARTQVSQLITNFNELITTNTEWRASYAKVRANLTTLIGDQRTDESPATPTTATPGAVGTSGTITLDPTVKAKLEEFRAHLLQFEKAASGGAPSEPASAASAAKTATMPSNTTAAGSTSAPPTATASAGPAGTTSTAPTPTGTSGTTPPAEPDPQTRPGAATPQSSQPPDQQAGHAEALRHIEAIEAILSGRSPSATPGAAGTAGSTTTPTSLDREQMEQIRTHLSALRRALGQSGGR